MPEPADLDTTSHAERDAASLKILGFFFSVLGLLVLVGTLWSLDNTPALIVNVASGAVLTLVGLGMIAYARRSRRQHQDQS